MSQQCVDDAIASLDDELEAIADDQDDLQSQYIAYMAETPPDEAAAAAVAIALEDLGWEAYAVNREIDGVNTGAGCFS